jgi:membrane protein DedA with SNARE-associated domain
VIDFIGALVQQYGALGIAVAMFAESAGVPFASAVVVITSGGMIYSGKVTFWSVFIASTVGITLGSIFSYSIGFGSSLMGKAIKSRFARRNGQKYGGLELPSRVEQSKIYHFQKQYGSFSVFMGQFWGVTRTFISFPAGAMHMNMLLFIIYTALGGAIFSIFAIGFSLLLTGTMGLLVKYTRLLLGLPPWIWIMTLLSLGALAIIYRRLGWKISIAPLWKRSKLWLERKK